MSIYVQFGVIITLILIFLMAISLVLIDNSKEDNEEDNEEDYEVEIISFDDIFDGNIDFNDFDFGSIVLDDNTDSMSEISEISNISSV